MHSSVLFNLFAVLCLVFAVHAWPVDDTLALDKRVKIITHPKPGNPKPGKLPSHPPPPPVKLPPHHPQPPVTSVCGIAKDCEKCTAKTFTVKGQPKDALHCAWLNVGAGKCVQRIANTPNLVTSAPQCAAIRAHQEQTAEVKADKDRVAAATGLWRSIEVHVLSGRDDKSVSGRHLASAWIARNGARGIEVDHATGLARLPFGLNGQKRKTVWLDTAAKAPYTGHFTATHVGEMCVAAAAASMKINKSTTKLLSGTHGFAVRSPVNGLPLCIEITKDSCYPADILPTAHAVGEKCSTQGGILPVD